MNTVATKKSTLMRLHALSMTIQRCELTIMKTNLNGFLAIIIILLYILYATNYSRALYKV